MAAAGAPAPPIYVEVLRWRKSPAGGHNEFEVACRASEKDRATLRVRDIKWSVFRRYSEFADLDVSLRRTFGYQMNAIKLPAKRMFGNKRPEFLDTRRVELETYMRGVLLIRRIADFASRSGFSDLRAFLNYDRRNAGMAETGHHATETDAEELGPDGSTVISDAPDAAAGRAGAKRSRRRRRHTGKGASMPAQAVASGLGVAAPRPVKAAPSGAAPAPAPAAAPAPGPSGPSGRPAQARPAAPAAASASASAGPGPRPRPGPARPGRPARPARPAGPGARPARPAAAAGGGARPARPARPAAPAGGITSNSALLGAIRMGTGLKPTVTVDKSKPRI